MTDAGLKILAEHLKPNCTLEELTFSETADHQKYWTEETRKSFVTLLQSHTKLKSVKAKFMGENQKCESSEAFRNEIEFYTDQKEVVKKKEKKIEKTDDILDELHKTHHLIEEDKKGCKVWKCRILLDRYSS